LHGQARLKFLRVGDCHSPHATTRVPAGAGCVEVGDELAVDAHPPGGQMLLDPLVGQPGGGEPVVHGRRGELVVGHGLMVHRRTDEDGRTGMLA
jgi:hypothetical protein